MNTKQVQSATADIAVKPRKYAYPLRPKRKPNEREPGNKVKLISNLFKLSIVQNVPIFFYAVEVNHLDKEETPSGDNVEVKKPRKLPSEIRRQILEKAIQGIIKSKKIKGGSFNYVYDHKISTLYTLFEIPSDPNQKMTRFEVEFTEDRIVGKGLVKHTDTFVVGLSKARKLDMSRCTQICKSGETTTPEANDLLRAINTIVRGHIVTLPSFVLTNTNIFPFENATKSKYQFEADKTTFANHGIFLSAKFIEAGVSLNIANTLATFYKDLNLKEFVTLQYGPQTDLSKPLAPWIIDELKKELKNKQVTARHHNYGTNKDRPHYRKYRIEDVAFSGMHKFSFVQNDKPREITIKEYFKMEYKLDLKFPNLPCIVHAGRKIPFEVCHLVEGQRIVRKNTPKETQAIITKSAVPAKEHFQRLDDHVKVLNQNSKPMKDFGLNFSLDAIKVDGRELQAMTMVGGGAGSLINPRDGNYDARRTKFLRPVQVQKWALAFIADTRVMAAKGSIGQSRLVFAERYVNEARSKGININPTPSYKWIEVKNDKLKMMAELRKTFEDLNKDKFDQCIFILPFKEIDWLYAYLQYLEASIKYPNTKSTRISCVKYENYDRKVVNDRSNGAMFLSNLWLKYNTKLGGVNFSLKPDPTRRYLSDGFLYISVDVCHPAPNDKLIQSVVGVVGMWDVTSSNMSFCTRLRVQKKSKETQSSTIEEVLELGFLFKEVVDNYKQRKGKFPTNIVIMRDGVSDGQLDIVIERELDQVLGLLNKLGKNRPKLTCLVVQKRHKQRFKREEPFKNFKGELDYNIQPGTVIDNTVTHPTHHDFYMASHKAIKGTSRPAHIYFRLDEIGFGVDEAQQMILSLSYLSPRCTKSTSIPTPVNLADLAAERAKNLVVSWNEENRTKMTADMRIKNLNEFLMKIGDPTYLNTLFYV